MPKTVALFVDVQTLHHQLRTKHHRFVDPALLLETAGAHGKVTSSVAVANWSDVPSDYAELFTAQDIPTVQVDRKTHGMSTRRREILHDMVGLELLAQVIELLFPDESGGSEVDTLILVSGEDAVSRIVSLVRERFHKDVHVIGVEGAVSERIQECASSWEALPMPPIEPTDLEGLEKLVPLLEDLEKKKRYLNFKYIRETVVRRLDLPEKSFEAAERLLSEAIACGLLLKHKIEDKYNPGQQFTAYALNRESPWFEKFGSGEAAPEHSDEPEEEAEPSKTKQKAPRRESREKAPRPPADEEDGKRRGRRRRRRRTGAKDGAPEAPPANVTLAAGAGNNTNKRSRRRKKGGQNHQQDRVGRSYEAPSRFLQDPTRAEKPPVNDDDIDEDRILAALGDL